MKRERAAAAILAILAALIGCIVFAGPRRTVQPGYTLKNGVTVTVLPVEPSEVMDVLEWKRWKFHAAVPTANGLQTDFEIWRDGKYAQTLGGISSGGGRINREFDVTLYMRPEFGDWSKDARVITRTQFGNGMAATRRSANPYRNIQWIGSTGDGTRSGGPVALPGDTLLLTTIFYQPLGEPVRGGPPRDDDPSFSLVLRMKPQSFPQDAPAAEPNFWQSLFSGGAR